MTLPQLALQKAIGQLGQQEHPKGSNWGHPVQDYLASVGVRFPAAWCIAFIYWCFNDAAKELNAINRMHRSGGVLDVWHHTDPKYKHPQGETGFVPQAGDICIMDHGGGLGHAGLVESFTDNVNLVEGNTNNNGSREGFEVERKSRSPLQKQIVGYIRLVD